MAIKKRLIALLGFSLFACNTSLPVSMYTASAISAASGAATIAGCGKLFEEAARQETLEHPMFSYEKAFLLNTLLIVLGGFTIPLLAFGSTIRARTLNAKFTIRDMRKKEILQQDSANRGAFYEYIYKAYADCSWPLMAAKDELKKYFTEIDTVKKEFKKVVLEMKKKQQNWQEGALVLEQLENLKTHVTVLLKLINEHPDYQKLIVEYENKKTNDNIAAAIRYQAHVQYNLN
jgi:hypothetical protein